MSYQCPVCGYSGLEEPPYNSYGCASFDICPCCGTEYGYHDSKRSHLELRREWVKHKMPWTDKDVLPPLNWDPIKQLADANLSTDT